jgi:hypothetical protein
MSQCLTCCSDGARSEWLQQAQLPVTWHVSVYIHTHICICMHLGRC